MSSEVDHPQHYNNLPAKSKSGEPIECIDVVRHMAFNPGNAIKYIWRAGYKGGSIDAIIQDYEKAIWYLNDELEKYKRLKSQMISHDKRKLDR